MSRKKLITLIVIIVLVLAGAGVGAWFWVQSISKTDTDTGEQPKPPVTVKEICTRDQLSRGAKAMSYPVNSAELSKVAKEIKDTTEYRSDVNCLYVLVQYDISAGLAADARSHLDALKGVYSSSVGYDDVFGRDAQSPAMLERMVSSLEEQFREFIKPDNQIRMTPEPELPDE